MAKEGKFRWFVIAWLFVVILLGYFDRVNLSMAAPFMMKEFNMTGAQMGLVMSGFYAGYMVLNFFAGFILTKYSSRLVLALVVTAWSIMTAITGLAAGFMSLLIIRIIFGITEGCVFPANMNIVNKWVTPKDKSIAVGLYLAGIPVGLVGGNMISGGIINAWGWQSVFFVYGAVGILMGFVTWKIIRDNPAEHPSVSKAEVDLIKNSQVIQPTTGGKSLGLVRILKIPWTWLFLLILFCLSMTFFGQVNWLPMYFIKGRGTGYMFSGAMASVPWAVALVGIFVISWLASRTLKYRGYWIFICLFAVAPCLAYAVMTPSLTLCVVLFSVAMFFNMGVQTLIHSVPMNIYAPEDYPIASGVFIGMSSFAGMMAPYLMGYILDVTGSFNVAYYILAGLSAIGGISGLVVVKAEKRVAATGVAVGREKAAA
ncbi:MAG: MFS transporter [Smithellaceae bacterium]